MAVSPQMLSAVVQSTILQILSPFVSDYLSQGAFNVIWEDPVFSTYFDTMFNGTMLSAHPLGNGLAGLNTTTTTKTGAGGTTSWVPSSYGWIQVQVVFGYAIMSAFSYLFAVGLERALPMRPGLKDYDAIFSTSQPRPQQPKREKVAVVAAIVEMSEDPDEEAAKRYLARAQARRRLSISWCNILAKWLIECVVHSAVDMVFWGFYSGLINGHFRGKSLQEVLMKIPWWCLGGWLQCWFSIQPFVLIVSILLIPAPSRVVFESALYLVWAVIWNCLLPGLVLRIVKSGPAQRGLIRWTELKKQKDEFERYSEIRRSLDEL
ncbi:hypothetical protein PGQ11_006162 [Apiospora arundinis]|uniref:Uncharacterized protein n=1 Tax=Apiospora arundinis TaxID=335852 RepID=A0ABR2IRW1_9PEZI